MAGYVDRVKTIPINYHKAALSSLLGNQRKMDVQTFSCVSIVVTKHTALRLQLDIFATMTLGIPLFVPIFVVQSCHFPLAVQELVKLEQAPNLKRRSQIFAVLLDLHRRLHRLALQRFFKTRGHIRPLITSNGLRNTIGSCNAPVIQAVPNVPNSGFHTAARRGDNNRLLF